MYVYVYQGCVTNVPDMFLCLDTEQAPLSLDKQVPPELSMYMYM